MNAREAGSRHHPPRRTAADLNALINAGAWMRKVAPEAQAEHLLAVVINGLRPDPDHSTRKQ